MDDMDEFGMISVEERLKQLEAENENLRIKLTEAEETLEAIQSGAVDAVVINTEEGKQVFTLQGADYSYRELVETMNEGAVTIAPDHTVMYCNERIAEMLHTTFDKITGNKIDSFIYQDDLPLFISTINKALVEKNNTELRLQASDGEIIPVLLSCNPFSAESAGIWLIFTDLTDLKRVQQKLELFNESLEYLVKERTKELKKSNKELKISEEKFRHLTENASDLIWTLNLTKGKYTYVGPSVLRLSGYTAEEAIHHSIEESLTPESVQKVHELIPIRIKEFTENPESNKVYLDQFGQNCKDGSVKWIEATTKLQYNAAGEIEVIGVSRDITERKRAEEQLKESEERFAEAFNNNTASLSITSIEDGVFLNINESFVNLYGYTREELIGKSSLKLNLFVNASDRSEVIRLLREKGQVNNMEIEARTKDGRILTVSTSAGKIHIRDEEYLLWTAIDVTERKRAEEALKKSEERFRLALKNSPVSVAIQDLNFVYQWAYNHRTRQTDEILGKTDADLFAPEDIPTILEVKRKVLETGKEVHVQHWVTSNGKRKFLDLYYEPTLNAAGEIDGIGIAVVDLTNQKLVEDALQKSEQRFRLLFETMPAGVVLQDHDGTIISMNPAAEDILGKTREDFLGSSSVEEEHDTIREDSTLFPGLEHPAMISLETGEKMKEVVMGVYNPQLQGYRWISVDSIPIINPKESRPSQVYTMFNDITERKNAEQALRESESRFRTITEVLPVLVSITRLEDSIVMFTNEYNNRAFGFKGEHIIGTTGSDYYCDPEDRRRMFAQFIEQGTVDNYELKVKRSDGTPFWIMTSVRPIVYQGYKAVIGASIDITLLKQAQEALKEIKDKLDLALENGNVGVWERDLKTNRMFWDTQTQKMMGFDEESFDGTFEAFEKRLVEEDVPHVQEAIRKALEDNLPYETIFRVKFPKGEIKYINSKGSITYDGEGNPVKFSGVCFDITDMKKGAEIALFKLNDELLRSNKELEQFAYIASHDLQEPLRMVATFMQLISKRYKDHLDEDGKNFVQFAMEGAHRSQMLINDLLKYSRVGTRGKVFSEVDFNQVLAVTLSNLAIKIGEKGAVITSDPMPVVMGDEGQLVQVMQNLLENAMKFSDKTPRVHISVKEEPDHYIFSVKDNGIGIEHQYSEKIFLIFQRLFPKGEYDGSGIGLAISKRIVERHGGNICFESELGKGTTFYFTIKKEVDNSYTGIVNRKTTESLNKMTSQTGSQLSEAERLKLMHETEVYKLELGMQYEELKQAKSIAEDALEKYVELYDFAPMAYFTLSREGKIIELNFGGAKVLGKDRSQIINKSFSFFVFSDTRAAFNQFLVNVFKNRVKETCLISILTPDNRQRDVYLTGIVTKNKEQCLVTVIDAEEIKSE